MADILYCLTVQHDPRWTIAAALICLLGVSAAFTTLRRAASLRHGGRRRAMVAAGALIGGLSIFSTHFVAMQGYQTGLPVAYDLFLTLTSFAIGLGSIMLASFLALRDAAVATRIVAAVLGVAGVAGMHFVGVFALVIPGVIDWNVGVALGSVTAAVLIAGVGAWLGKRAGERSLAFTIPAGVLAIVVLHFGCMAAMRITPSMRVIHTGGVVSGEGMLIVVGAMVAAILMLASTVAGLGYLQRTGALSRIRDAIDAMPDGLAFYDADDRLVLWNHRYAEVNPELNSTLQVGMTFREIVQIGLDEGLYAEAKGREAEWVEERMAARACLSSQMEQHVAGDRWLRVSDRRTAAGGIVTVCNDITELKHAARDLEVARDAAEAASVAKSQFLANMSHEIRTPLNGVIGLAQALAKTELSIPQREMLDLIQSSGQTLQVLLSDILDLARVESGRLEIAEDAFDLGRAMREAAQLYETNAREKGLSFFVEIAPEVDGWVHGDVVRIKQIVTNLISNAVKFTDSGFVSLTVAAGPRTPAGPTLRVSVEDTGLGFDAATRERLFSRFEQADGGITRKFGGSGLGLSISRQLAEMMGGELDCESEPGGGSAFMLTLPHRPAQAPAAVVGDEAVETGGRSLRVLLADDHPVNRKVVEMILASIEVDLTTAENGAEALAAYRDGGFDIVLMDMQMPVMDGLTATREIRLHEAALGLERTPVVMLTANALAEHVASAHAAGADHHLAKPFDAGELLALVQRLPGERTAVAA